MSLLREKSSGCGVLEHPPLGIVLPSLLDLHLCCHRLIINRLFGERERQVRHHRGIIHWGERKAGHVPGDGPTPAPSSPRAAAGRPSTYTRVKPPPGGSRLGPVAANPTCFTCKGGLERIVPRQSSLLLLLCCSIAPSARPRHGTDPGAVPAEPPAPPAPLRTSPDSQTCSPNTILCFLLVTRFKITPRQSAPEALAAGFLPSHRRGRGALA